MSKGPNGEQRSADAVGCAVRVAKIATGEIVELPKTKSKRTKSGQAGVAARAAKLTQNERQEIAQKAAMARWKK